MDVAVMTHRGPAAEDAAARLQDVFTAARPEVPGQLYEGVHR